MSRKLILLDFQVRNAIQALQILASSPQSNPNLPTPGRGNPGSGSGLLARSSSHPPDALCWSAAAAVGQQMMPAGPVHLVYQSTQTDWPVDLLESWVRSDPQRVLRILGLDPELVLRVAPSGVRRPSSPTPSPSSPPPPPYEPLSPLLGSPSQSPSQSPGKNSPFVLCTGFFNSVILRTFFTLKKLHKI